VNPVIILPGLVFVAIFTFSVTAIPATISLFKHNFNFTIGEWLMILGLFSCGFIVPTLCYRLMRIIRKIRIVESNLVMSSIFGSQVKVALLTVSGIEPRFLNFFTVSFINGESAVFVVDLTYYFIQSLRLETSKVMATKLYSSLLNEMAAQ
jgi:hypothetical protein